MERIKIQLNNEQWRDLIWENCIEVEGELIKFKEIKDIYGNTNRHTESHSKILQRISDNKYFRVYYETSVKDSMGWDECNYGGTEAIEVFPEQVTTTIYK